MDLINIISKVFSFISLYVVTWFILIFAILPFNLKVKQSNPEHFAASAPENPHIKGKYIINSVLSLIITIILFYILVISDFSFKTFIEKL